MSQQFTTTQETLSRENTHFRHTEIQQRSVCEFEPNHIVPPEGRLTLVIRNDADFATRHINYAFSQTGIDTTQLMRQAYRTWGHSIVEATADHLDYSGKYGLNPNTASDTNIHFHSSDKLATAVLKKAECFLEQNYSDADRPVFISLDDMIHSGVFKDSAVKGHFGEVGFSRLFSLTGEEMGFVGRPGKRSIEGQIDTIANMIHLGGQKKNPIILLEDNVRRAKTLLWIFNEMEKNGLFKNAELAAVATCFSVATPEEETKIVHNGRQIPLLVGVNYAGGNGVVDVITPRDHLFDGFVVDCRNQKGRLPSFMLSAKEVASNFKIEASQAHSFVDRVHEINMSFCKSVHKETGRNIPVGWFGPGEMIAQVMSIPATTPMASVLETVRKHRTPQLTIVK